MDIVLLRTFLEVSKTRHFGRASENLHITQSAVSFRVRQLEELIGAKLFERQRNNLHLSPLGERLIPYAESILATWQRALQEVGVPQQQKMQLSIGGTANIWDVYLQSKLPELAHAFPELSQRTEVEPQIHLVRALLERRIDIGLVFDPPKIAEVCVEKLCELQLCLQSPAPEQSLHALEQIGYIHIDWGTAFNVEHAKLFEQQVIPVLHTSQSRIAYEYLARCGGAAFLPLKPVASETIQLYPVEGALQLPRSIYAIYHNDSDKLETIAQVIDLLRDTGQ